MTLIPKIFDTFFYIYEQQYEVEKLEAMKKFQNIDIFVLKKKKNRKKFKQIVLDSKYQAMITIG